MQRHFIFWLVIVLLLGVGAAAPGAADSPRLISLQGQLADEFSETLPDDNYQITFSIYADAAGGVALWQETRPVPVVGGIYDVILGTLVTLDLPFDVPYYLGVKVEPDDEMTPRLPLTSVPYALRAAEADAVADGAVTQTMIAVGAVTTDAVADGAITAVKVDDGAGSGLDADLLDGLSAESFLGVDGGTVHGLLTLEGTTGPQLMIRDSGISNQRPGVQFTGNNIHFVAGDDLSDEYFGFYSGYSSSRTYDAKLRVYGKASGSWNRSIGMTHDGTDGSIDTDTGDLLLAPAVDVRLASGKGIAFADGSRQTTAYTASLETRVATLESEIAALKSLLLNVTRTGSDIRFNGVNLHVNNGTGTTGGAVNGLGNLVVGYNETRLSGNVRSGSHNIIVGQQNNYSSYGGLVAGMTNTVSGVYASVTGGRENTADGLYASISGGAGNDASGEAASVSGGYINHADGSHASVSGGRYSTASGNYASVSGGRNNTAGGEESSVSGGNENSAVERYSSVTGGYLNSADGWWSTVSGGYDRHALGQLDWWGGHLFSED